MNPFSGIDINTLFEMVKDVSTKKLYDLCFSIKFEDPTLFLEVLRFLSDKLDDFAYKEHRPKLEEWLNKMQVSSSLKNEILAFYKEAVDVHQGRGRQVELALYLFYEEIQSYLSSCKPIMPETDYLAIEEFAKFPKEKLLRIISEDVSDYVVSRQQSLKKEIDERKDSPISAELRQFHENRNKHLNEQEIKMLTNDMDQVTIGEGSAFSLTRYAPNQIGH